MAARAACRPRGLMPTPITLNVKAPPATTGEGFRFVFQTTPLTSRKDSSYDLLYDDSAHVNVR